MLIITHTVETTASLSAIWKTWEDVSSWNTWDPCIESSRINGPFQTGTTGILKLKRGSTLHTRLTQVEPMKMFVDEAKLPLTRIIVTHSLTKSGGRTCVTHKIEMKGLLSFLFAFLVGRDMKKKLPQEMMTMVRNAELLEKSKHSR